jgi:hypothetical protein
MNPKASCAPARIVAPGENEIVIGQPVKPDADVTQSGPEVEVETGTVAVARTSDGFGNEIEMPANVPVVSPTMTAVEGVLTAPKITTLSMTTSAPVLFVKISYKSVLTEPSPALSPSSSKRPGTTPVDPPKLVCEYTMVCAPTGAAINSEATNNGKTIRACMVIPPLE